MLLRLYGFISEARGRPALLEWCEVFSKVAQKLCVKKLSYVKNNKYYEKNTVFTITRKM